LPPRSNKYTIPNEAIASTILPTLVDGTKTLSKQMFCRFNHFHTQRTICPFHLSRHSK
jgi:hypothetical protein